MGARLHSREVKIAACADYLLNVPLKVIAERHGLGYSTVVFWVRQAGQFKLRGYGARTFLVVGRGAL